MNPEIRPALRRDLVVSKHVLTEEVSYVVKDPVQRKYYRFGELEFEIMSLLDGTCTMQVVKERFEENNPGVEVSLDAVSDFVGLLDKDGLLDKTGREKSTLLLEKIRAERGKKLKRTKPWGNILYVRIKLFDPDKILEWFVGKFPFFWHRPFFLVSVSFVVFTVLFSYGYWREGRELEWAVRSTVGGGFGIIQGYILLLILVALHEFAHGLTCKYFGGEVREIGFLLLYLTPCLYCNVSDAWSFSSKARRLWVTFAGGYFEIILGALALLMWRITPMGTVTHDVSFKVALLAFSSGLLFNLNPLIKMDGYYALSDYLEVPNLRDNSVKYVSYLVKKYLLGMQQEKWELTSRLKRIYIIYGTLSTLYVTSILSVVLIYLGPFLSRELEILGVLIFFITAYALLRKYFQNTIRVLKAFYLDRRESLRMKKNLVPVIGAVIAILALLSLKVPQSARVKIQLELLGKTTVWAEESGFLGELTAKEGDFVKEGSVLAKIRSPGLEAERITLSSREARLRREITSALSLGEKTNLSIKLNELSQVLKELEYLRQKESSLTIRAPFDGIVSTAPRPEEKGNLVSRGGRIFEMGKREQLYGGGLFSEKTASRVRGGEDARLKLRAYPGMELSGKVKRVSLSPFERANSGRGLRTRIMFPPEYTVYITLFSSGIELKPGMTGTARIRLGKKRISRLLLDPAAEFLGQLFF